MANTRAGNVVRVDTSANFSNVREIATIKYIGITSGTCVITKATDAGDSSGSKLYEASGATNELALDLDIRVNRGVYVSVANGAVVYLYLGDC
jgi:hypothetical protein